MARSNYACVCVEIDLSILLSRGFWIGDYIHRVFVVIMYECLPTFCYTCGMIGHSSNSCSRSIVAGANRTNSFCPVRLNRTMVSQVSPAEDRNIDDIEHDSAPPSSEQFDHSSQLLPESDYGP